MHFLRIAMVVQWPIGRPLVEILKQMRKDGGELVERYLVYKAHVCRQVYANVDNIESRLEARETE